MNRPVLLEVSLPPEDKQGPLRQTAEICGHFREVLARRDCLRTDSSDRRPEKPLLESLRIAIGRHHCRHQPYRVRGRRPTPPFLLHPQRPLPEAPATFVQSTWHEWHFLAHRILFSFPLNAYPAQSRKFPSRQTFYPPRCPHIHSTLVQPYAATRAALHCLRKQLEERTYC